VSLLQVDQHELKISRMSHIITEGTISHLRFEYMVGTREGISHFSENHIMGLFTHEEYSAAVTNAGFRLIYEAEGLTGRGVYIGVRD
jgi:hypothetical protein